MLTDIGPPQPSFHHHVARGRLPAASRLLRRSPSPAHFSAAAAYALLRHARPFSPPRPPPPQRPTHSDAELEVTPVEARRLVPLVGVEALKQRLRDGQEDVVWYDELLDACVDAGAARTHAEAEALARAMDDAGVLLLFRDKAYLHPEKWRSLMTGDEKSILEITTKM